MNIHVTDIALFKRCRRAFRLAVMERLTAKKERDDTRQGTIGHNILNQYYETGCHKDVSNLMSDLCDNVLRNEDVNTRDLFFNLMSSYWYRWGEKDKFLTIKSVENRLSHRIPNTDFTLVGSLDMIVYNGGATEVWDNKFRSQLTSVYEIDEQCTGYWYLAVNNGIKVGKFIFNEVLRKEPQVPKLLTKGMGLSKATNIVTTPWMFIKTIHDYGLDPKDYDTVIKELTSKDKFFRRVPQTRFNRQLELYEQDLIGVCHAIKDCIDDLRFPPTTKWYPSPQYDCHRNCQFFDVCKVESTGGDTSNFKKELFRTKDYAER